MIWYLCGRKRVWELLQRLFAASVSGCGKNKKSEPETPCSASGETFFGKPLDKRSEVCYADAPDEERAAGQAPDVLDILMSAPTCGGGDRGDLEAAPARRSRRLPCESGVEHLEN